MTLFRQLVLVLLVSSFNVNCFGNELQAQEFYRDKTITYIVATKPGGGYDAYARIIARYMEKYLPNTRIRIKNLPGAGSILGTNHLYVAKADGLTIGTFNSGLIYSQLLQRFGIRFDLTQLSWIGAASRNPRVIVASSKSGIKSIDVLRSSERIIFASSGIGSAAHNETLFIGNILNLNSQIIPFLSGSDAQMSMMRGEVAAVCASYSSIRPFVENGYGNYLLHIGGEAIFGNTLPSLRTLVGETQAIQVVDLIETVSKLGRVTAAPPGVPGERLAVLRDAYSQALADPDLRAETRRLKLPIEPTGGGSLGVLVAEALSQPAPMNTLLRSLVGTKSAYAR